MSLFASSGGKNKPKPKIRFIVFASLFACAALAVLLITGWTGSSLRPESEFGYLWIAIDMMYGMLARKPAT